MAQQQTGPHQQVVELEAPAGPPLLGGLQGEGGQPRHQHLQCALCRPVQDLCADRWRPLVAVRGQVLEGVGGGRLVGLPLVAAAPVALAAPSPSLPGVDGRSQDLDAGHIVVSVLEPGQLPLDGLDPGVQGVPGAGGAPVLDLADGPQACRDVVHVDPRQRITSACETRETVPVLVEPHGQSPDVLQPHSQHLEPQQRGTHLGLVEEPVEEVPPADVELDLGADVVEHLDARRQPGLHRVLGQDPLGEGVQRAHRGAVELEKRGPGPLLAEARRGLVAEQLPADPVPQLGGGLLGEGDGRDVLHGDPRADEGQHPVDEGPGLARAGAGLDEERGAQVGPDPRPGGLVDQLGAGHVSVPAACTLPCGRSRSGSTRSR